MPSLPDLREIASNVKEAFADMDRDALLDILTFVIKEYVVEGPPPMLIHQAETLSDLNNLSFAQLVTTLQTRFDFPELAMFVVDGEQVSVRIGGVVHPLLAQRTPAPRRWRSRTPARCATAVRQARRLRRRRLRAVLVVGARLDVIGREALLRTRSCRARHQRSRDGARGAACGARSRARLRQRALR